MWKLHITRDQGLIRQEAFSYEVFIYYTSWYLTYIEGAGQTVSGLYTVIDHNKNGLYLGAANCYIGLVWSGPRNTGLSYIERERKV